MQQLYTRLSYVGQNNGEQAQVNGQVQVGPQPQIPRLSFIDGPEKENFPPQLIISPRSGFSPRSPYQSQALVTPFSNLFGSRSTSHSRSPSSSHAHSRNDSVGFAAPYAINSPPTYVLDVRTRSRSAATRALQPNPPLPMPEINCFGI